MEDVLIIATAEEVREFLRLRNTGSGDGYGYGSGSGYGYGSGDGYGSGYGSGSGDGSGSGSGYGSVDGSGIKSYNGHPVHIIDGVQTIIAQVRGDLARGYIVKGDMTLEPCWIARVDNCWAHGETAEDAVRDAEEKALDDTPLEDRVARFVASFPDADAPVPFAELYKWHHILTGSCKLGRDTFVANHNLDTSADYTPRYFVNLTRNAYGKEAIALLAKAYGITPGTE